MKFEKNYLLHHDEKQLKNTKLMKGLQHVIHVPILGRSFIFTYLEIQKSGKAISWERNRDQKLHDKQQKVIRIRLSSRLNGKLMEVNCQKIRLNYELLNKRLITRKVTRREEANNAKYLENKYYIYKI